MGTSTGGARSAAPLLLLRVLLCAVWFPQFVSGRASRIAYHNMMSSRQAAGESPSSTSTTSMDHHKSRPRRGKHLSSSREQAITLAPSSSRNPGGGKLWSFAAETPDPHGFVTPTPVPVRHRSSVEAPRKTSSSARTALGQTSLKQLLQQAVEVPKNAIRLEDLKKAHYRFSGVHAYFIGAAVILGVLVCALDLKVKRDLSKPSAATNAPNPKAALAKETTPLSGKQLAKEEARQAKIIEEMMNRRRFLEHHGVDELNMAESESESESEAKNEKEVKKEVEGKLGAAKEPPEEANAPTMPKAG